MVDQASGGNVAFTHKLVSPLRDRGKQIDLTELNFRKPRAGDIARIGVPVYFQPLLGQNKVDIDAARMLEMMARLNLENMTPLDLEPMDPNDFMNIAWSLSGFFIGSPVELPSG